MIEIAHLSKRFSNAIAVDDVSFQAVSGEVLGLLGPNGAGKSTTLRMLIGFMSPSAGTARLCGFDICRQPRHAQRLMGYLPETGACYDEMSVSGFLNFVAEVRGYRGRHKRQRVMAMLEQFELLEVRGQIIDVLSKGFRRRVGLAQAMLHDPKILILDEPTDSLDPNQKYRVHEQIKAIARDKIVIISTHSLEEVTALCGRVLVMDKGRLLADSTPAELESRSRYHQAVMLYGTQPLDVMTLAMLPGVAGIEAGPEPHSVRVLARPGAIILPAINTLILTRGWDVPRQEVERGSLGDVFRLLTHGKQS